MAQPPRKQRPVIKKDKALPPGEIGKQIGMTDVEAGANEEWKRYAAIAVRRAARSKPFVTTDDFKAYMPDGIETKDDRAWGPVVRAAVFAGLLSDSKLPNVPSTWPACHRRPLRIWVSEIYQGARRVA